jgi:hypothetical protein
MNSKSLVKLSNIIGIISIILLVYWVFIFISITVFGFKIFKENITETFYLSIIGILALMFGSLIINIMFNLTRIAEKHNQDDHTKNLSKKTGLLFGLSFPLVFGLLYIGDYLTSQKKEKMLISSAKSIIEHNKEKSNKLLHYAFNEQWIMATDDILDLFSMTDKHFPYVSVIVSDSIDQSQVFLEFKDYHGTLNDTIKPIKKNFIQQTTHEERTYLNNVFYHNLDEIRFSADDGKYELFYPYIDNNKKIVLYFSDYQRYGKMGK